MANGMGNLPGEVGAEQSLSTETGGDGGQGNYPRMLQSANRAERSRRVYFTFTNTETRRRRDVLALASNLAHCQGLKQSGAFTAGLSMPPACHPSRHAHREEKTYPARPRTPRAGTAERIPRRGVLIVSPVRLITTTQSSLPPLSTMNNRPESSRESARLGRPHAEQESPQLPLRLLRIHDQWTSIPERPSIYDSRESGHQRQALNTPHEHGVLHPSSRIGAERKSRLRLEAPTTKGGYIGGAPAPPRRERYSAQSQTQHPPHPHRPRPPTAPLGISPQGQSGSYSDEDDSVAPRRPQTPVRVVLNTGKARFTVTPAQPTLLKTLPTSPLRPLKGIRHREMRGYAGGYGGNSRRSMRIGAVKARAMAGEDNSFSRRIIKMRGKEWNIHTSTSEPGVALWLYLVSRATVFCLADYGYNRVSACHRKNPPPPPSPTHGRATVKGKPSVLKSRRSAKPGAKNRISGDEMEI
ncbi:hypothetical protein R3P38DRAFT_2776327 [Favolaschia claudopus]|uniref:Uncharacterized protein n=1 Tax=Favolaschia claudopus TaxID=2862362 RepID=A0AAW0BPY1_9AGAR